MRIPRYAVRRLLHLRPSWALWYLRRIARAAWGHDAPRDPGEIFRRAVTEGLLTPADIAAAMRDHQVRAAAMVQTSVKGNRSS